MVLVSAQYLIDDRAVDMLYGVPLVVDDPGGLTAIPVTIGTASGWLNIARDITRIYRGALVEHLGTLDPADLDRVDKAIYNTFGLPL
ncbi:MAG: hypothetical protein JO100_09425 [Pseudonocardia sp.]|nr:hypothetical protein [Pseudonocardia sp.]